MTVGTTAHAAAADKTALSAREYQVFLSFPIIPWTLAAIPSTEPSLNHIPLVLQ